jgi:hypothetical protein
MCFLDGVKQIPRKTVMHHCVVLSRQTNKRVGKQLEQLVDNNSSPTPVGDEISEWVNNYIRILTLSTGSGPSCKLVLLVVRTVLGYQLNSHHMV